MSDIVRENAPGGWRSWRTIHVVFGLLLLALSAAGIPFILDPNIPGDMPVERVWLNILPVVLLGLIPLAIWGRPFMATLWIVGFFTLAFYTSSVKLATLQEPLVYADFLLLTQIVTASDLTGKYASLGALMAGACGFGLLVLALWKWERRIFGIIPGLVVLVASLGGLVTLGDKNWPLGRVYHSGIISPNDWIPAEYARDNGLIASVARSAAIVTLDLPEIDAQDIHRPSFLPQSKSVNTSTFTPDIVVILSESFFDPAILREVEPCEQLPRYCELQQKGISGRLTVPTFGGNTPRTEFELLTAIPFISLGSIGNPYNSTVTRPMLSLPRMLKNRGYRTSAIHPHLRTFWRRQVALPWLGVDRFIADQDMAKYDYHGFFAPDDILTRELMGIMESQQNQPQFVFLISMENHGPWNALRRSRLPDTVDDMPVPEKAAAIADTPLKQFVYHARKSLQELEKTRQWLETRQRPTLLVFFGDHLPALNRTYAALGFDDGLDARAQKTPYLVLSNFPVQPEIPETLPVHQLLIQTFQAAGIPLDQPYADLQQAWDAQNLTLSDTENAQLQRYIADLQTLLLATSPDS